MLQLANLLATTVPFIRHRPSTDMPSPSTSTLIPAVSLPTRENNPSGSQMATRHASSSRQSRWQPYILGTHSIPNKKALPCLVRPRLSAFTASSNSGLLAQAAHAPASDASSPRVQPARSDDGHREPTTTKQHDSSSQLPTPNHSPPGMPPALLQQTSSNYVLGECSFLFPIYWAPNTTCRAVIRHPLVRLSPAGVPGRP